MSSMRLLLATPAVLLVVALSACSDDAATPGRDAGRSDGGGRDAGRSDAGRIDAGTDAGAPDAGFDAAECATEADCDDGLDCTADTCAAGSCVFTAPDEDMDGFALEDCLDGDDCDDTEDTIHPEAVDVCDGRDNDCRGTADDGPGLTCVRGTAGASCTTACGSSGMQICDDTCHFGACAAPRDHCGNACDDDADGTADDGCIAGAPNDWCPTAIDVTGLGTFTGTTCGADDSIDLGLGAPGCATPVSAGTPDVFYSLNPPAAANYRFVITPGFALQFVPAVCDGNGGCGPYPSTADFTIGTSGGARLYFAVEASSGCGEYELTVTTF
jgi:hypothetical protein